MSIFLLYLKLGFRFILDIYNVGHILFIVSLAIIFMPKDWRRVLILLASFTFGYSITLVISALELVSNKPEKISFLLAFTIFITSVSNIFRKKDQFQIHKNIQRNYFFAFFFGIIHGFGFSNYFTSVFGKEQSLAKPFIGYIIGLEFGQIVVTLFCLFTSYILVNIAGINRRDWVLVISSAIAGVGLTIMFENKFW